MHWNFSVTFFLLISVLNAQVSQGALDRSENSGAPSQINSIQENENKSISDSKSSEPGPTNLNQSAFVEEKNDLDSTGNEVNDKIETTSEDTAIRTEAKNAINEFARRMSQNIFNTSATSTNKSGEHSQLAKTLIWSPFSVYQSLVPLFYGANGETRRELQSILLPHHSQDAKEDEISFVTDLDKVITRNNRGEGSSKPLSSATGIFSREDLRLNPDYLNALEKNVKNVELKSVEFSNVTSAVSEINSWVQEKTKGLIEEAIDEDQIDQSMFMMIVNCVRFKAPWQVQFNPNLTSVQDFHGVSGVQKVQMMHTLENQFYGEFPRKKWFGQKGDAPTSTKEVQRFAVLEMPYKATDLVSLFILPKSNEDLEDTMNYLEDVGVERIMAELTSVEVNLSLPKFKISSNVDVVDALEENGLRSLFSPIHANLTKIFAPPSPTPEASLPSKDGDEGIPKNNTFIPPPYLSRIIHRTVFETSEEGTSAGAITALSIVPLSALGNQEAVEFNLNRPFIVMLVKNGTILFQGIIADLTGQDLTTSSENVESSTRYNLPANSTNDNEITVDNASAAIPSQNETNEDRAWWKRKGIPGYLKLNLTSNNSQEQNKPEISQEMSQAPPPAIMASSPSPLPPKNTFIQFTKYQQPEPRDPDGIRFPATYPLTRNKGHIRPRYDHYSQNRRNSIRNI